VCCPPACDEEAFAVSGRDKEGKGYALERPKQDAVTADLKRPVWRSWSLEEGFDYLARVRRKVDVIGGFEIS